MRQREYILASRLLSSVLSDVPFVGDETYVKLLFRGMEDDPHPDAIAMRLRIALQCNDCSELPPFGKGSEGDITSMEEYYQLRDLRLEYMRKEFDKYITKWPSVSL